MRMVGRCLVCSRLISTWVSSLEPPPSTPSTVLHLHTHSHTHTHTIHQNRQSCSTTERIQRHRHQEACVLLHRSKFMSVSYVSPSRLLSPVRGSNPLSNPTAIRFFHSPSYSADVSRTARSLVQPVNNLSFKLPGLAACPSCSRLVFSPLFPTTLSFFLSLPFTPREEREQLFSLCSSFSTRRSFPSHPLSTPSSFHLD